MGRRKALGGTRLHASTVAAQDAQLQYGSIISLRVPAGVTYSIVHSTPGVVCATTDARPPGGRATTSIISNGTTRSGASWHALDSPDAAAARASAVAVHATAVAVRWEPATTAATDSGLVPPASSSRPVRYTRRPTNTTRPASTAFTGR